MAKQKAKFKVLAPLKNFSWSGNIFQLDEFSVEKYDQIPDVLWNDSFLSEIDKDDIQNISYWLSFEQSPNDKLSPSEKINMFLLALWIVRPTRVHVLFRFELPHETGNGQLKSTVRYYDHFQRIKYQAKNQIETKHLQKLGALIEKLKTIYISRKRLWNSFVLTFNGCTTIHWQVAFICFTAAVEGILTYEKGGGITRRLAKSFVCLTKKTKTQRDTTYRTFIHSYGIRSDIMHGRIVLARPRKSNNLKELTKFSNLLRNLWKTILSSNVCLEELEKDDAGRKSWFTRLENDYHPPKI